MKTRQSILIMASIFIVYSSFFTQRTFQCTQYWDEYPRVSKECIDYSKTSYSLYGNNKFIVDIGVAVEQNILKKQPFLIRFNKIQIYLSDYKYNKIYSYDVNMQSYLTDENSFSSSKFDIPYLARQFFISKSDFKLTYSFDLYKLLPMDYDDSIYFSIEYCYPTNEQNGTDQSTFLCNFHLHYKRSYAKLTLNQYNYFYGELSSYKG